jgi:hypothetical protein
MAFNSGWPHCSEGGVMLRKLTLSAATLLTLAALAAPAAMAGVPRVILAEDFMATWCTYCPGSLCALEQVRSENPDRFIFIEDHCSSTDPFTTSETTARENWYQISGYPTIWFDGLDEQIGAANCSEATVRYRNSIAGRMAATDGSSPILITSSINVVAGTASVSATFKLIDPVNLTNLRATIMLLEDNIYWCCGYGGQSIWSDTTRKIADQSITLTNVGDEVTVNANVPIGTWNPAELKAVAYVQSTATKEVFQAQNVGQAPAPDFSVYYPSKVESVPAGNGTAVFTGQLWNLSTSSQTFTLEPGTSFGTWTTDFLVCGDANPHSGPTQITLPANGTCDFQVRVHTDGTRVIRSGSFKVTSNASGRLQTNSMRVFNGSYSVYLINDSTSLGGGSGIWTTELTQLGYLYDQWDINNDHAGAAPSWGNVRGYDILIWETGYRTSSLPNTDEQLLMQQFVDAGGSLYFTSQAFLNSLNNVQNAFTQNYLGLSGWTLDTGYTNLSGVSGDPIGDGFNLPLTFQFPSYNKGDNATPSTAVTGLRGEESSSALVHNIKNGAKIVFMPAAFNAISQTDADPNNQKYLLGRILDWLHPAPPADAPDAAVVLASRIDAVRPNPFNPRTEIGFTLSPAGANGTVSLEVFDLGGRKVAQLVNGRMSPGAHVETWTGISDGGKPAESGVYFARLTTADGTRTQKMVLLK